MSENLNEPQSRTEEILQNALGEEYDVTPQSRVEKLLEQVVDGGGSGSGASLITTKYLCNTVNVPKGQSVSTYVNFPTPLDESKVRAMWVTNSSECLASIMLSQGGGGKIYQTLVRLGFFPNADDSRVSVTETPALYVTMEE